MAKCISVSATRFDSSQFTVQSLQFNKNVLRAFFSILFTVLYFLSSVFCYAELVDRVVAFVDDQAITLSEFRDQYRDILGVSPDIGEEEVLNTLVNRKLLLKEAKKYRIEASSEEQVIREYIDLKVRAFIRVNEAEIADFYEQNIDQFSGKGYEDVRGEIETYITEKKINERLKEMLIELRRKAYIKIQLKPE